MVHQRGDHWLLLPYKAPIIKADGFVVATGDLPDELKTEDSLIVECPLPVMKYPRPLPVNITEREKIIIKFHMEGVREFQANLNEAAKRPKMATISCKQSEDAPPTTMNMLEMGAVKGKEKKRFEEEKKAVRQTLVEQLKLLMSVYEELEKVILLSLIVLQVYFALRFYKLESFSEIFILFLNFISWSRSLPYPTPLYFLVTFFLQHPNPWRKVKGKV